MRSSLSREVAEHPSNGLCLVVRPRLAVILTWTPARPPRRDSTVSASEDTPRLYGSFDSAVPIAHVFETAAKVSPPPIPAASHFSRGIATLPTTADNTIEPATSRT